MSVTYSLAEIVSTMETLAAKIDAIDSGGGSSDIIDTSDTSEILEARIDELQSKLEDMQTAIDELQGLDNKIDVLEERIDALGSGSEATDVTELENRVDNLETINNEFFNI